LTLQQRTKSIAQKNYADEICNLLTQFADPISGILSHGNARSGNFVAKSIDLPVTQPDVAILAIVPQITGQSIKLSYDEDCEQSYFKNFSPPQNYSFFGIVFR
jgi:hypothetical protein